MKRKQPAEHPSQADELRKLTRQIAKSRAESRKLLAKLVLADYNAARLGIDPEELLRPLAGEADST